MSIAIVNSEIRSELESVAKQFDCELLHVDFAAGRLRLILDRPEGVTLRDCESVSREASAALDVLDFGGGRYTLEVSSPGLDREFYRDEDYERFAGNRVSITWIDSRTSSKRTDIGLLKTVRAAGASPSIEVETEQEQLIIRLQDVIKTHLEPVF